MIRDEALRSLRFRSLDSTLKVLLTSIGSKHDDSKHLADAALDTSSFHQNRPALNETDLWLSKLDAVPGKADVDSGRRIFFHSKVAQCANCHRHDGRGNVVGPDLSFIAKQNDRTGILKSILEPNREVAPQFYATRVELTNETIFTGILLRSSNRQVFRDLNGKEQSFNNEDIVRQKELTTSLMPTGLVETLTDTELRDLLAFLGAGDLRQKSTDGPEEARAESTK